MCQFSILSYIRLNLTKPLTVIINEKINKQDNTKSTSENTPKPHQKKLKIRSSQSNYAVYAQRREYRGEIQRSRNLVVYSVEEADYDSDKTFIRSLIEAVVVNDVQHMSILRIGKVNLSGDR